MSKLKPWLLLAVIFMAGGVTGSTLTLWLAPHFHHPPGPHDMKSHWMMMLNHRLTLTSEQQAKIEPILTDADNQLQAVRQDEGDRVSQIMEKAHGQIAAVLTPEQQVELQQMEKDMEHNRDRMFPGRKRPWSGMHGGAGEDGAPQPPPPPPPPN